MKTVSTLILVFLHLYSYSQKAITIKEVGWTLTPPSTFTPMDSARIAMLNSDGSSTFEDATGLPADMSKTKTVFAVQKKDNYFYSTLTPFVEEHVDDYANTKVNSKKLIYQTFQSLVPGGPIDTSSMKVMVGGLEFEEFKSHIKMGDINITCIMLWRLYKGYDFGICYMYLDESTKREVEKSVYESKFSK